MKGIVALAVACVFLLLGTARTARAARLDHPDLVSLAFDAEDVVRAHKVSEKKVSDYQTIQTMVVTKAYKGGLAIGAQLTTTLDLYSFETMDEWDGTAKKAVVDPEMILFLVRPRSGYYGGEAGTHAVLDNGVRIFRDGKAHRFVQMSNPGGYAPTPQGIDPWDMCQDPRAKVPVDFAAFEAQLAHALERAGAIRRLMAAPDSAENRRSLAASVGEARDFGNEPSCFTDWVGPAVLRELGRRNDVVAVLDAGARMRDVVYPWTMTDNVLPLLDAAGDAKLPLDSRVAALRILAARGSFVLRARDAKGEGERRVIARMADPSPRIRAAAAALRTADKVTPLMRQAILARWAIEKDERVRYALAETARGYDMLADVQSGATWPVVAIYATGDTIHVDWSDVRHESVWPRLHVTLTRDGRKREADLKPYMSMWTGSGGVSGTRLVLDPPLEPGEYDADVVVSLEADASDGPPPVVTRTAHVGAVFAPRPLAVAPAAPAVAGPPAPSTAPRVFGPPPPETKRSGCGCEVERSGGDRGGLTLALGMLALIVARRSQRATS